MFTLKLTAMEIYLYYFLATEGAHITLQTHPKFTDNFKKPQA